MGLDTTYNLFAGILLIVLAAFIAAPAWSRWTRNISLVRQGIKTTGHYQGRFQVAFHLPSGKKVLFSTWRFPVWRYSLGDELPVLYDPDHPSRAEVMKAEALWGSPLSNLIGAAADVVLAIALFRGANIGIAILLSIAISLASYPIARLALYLCYPPSRLDQFKQANIGLAPEKKDNTSRQRPEPPQPSAAPLLAQEKRLVSKSKSAAEPGTVRPPRPYIARGLAAREQLLRDMIDIPDDL